METIEATTQTLKLRSNFVTVLAWVFIVISGLRAVIILFGIVALKTMHADRMQHILSDPKALKHASFVTKFMMTHLQLIAVISLTTMVLMLIASIGLLKRRNWARILFIIMLAIGIIRALGSILYEAMYSKEVWIGPEGRAIFNIHQLQSIIYVMTTMFGIGLTVLFVWIIKNLVSKDIRQEFIGKP